MIHYALTSLRVDPVRGAGYFVPPANAIGTLDFRSLPGHAGTDFIFAALDDSIAPVDADDRVIVTAPAPVHDLSIAVAAKDRTAWADALGMTIPNAGSTLADLLAATLLAGDIEGQDAVKPLMPVGDTFEIHLGGHSLVWSRKVGQNNARDPFMAKAMAVRRADIMRVTDPILRGKLITDALTKGRFEVTRAAAKTILGIDEKPLPRRTSYSDDFTRADASTLGGNWSRPEGTRWGIGGNKAYCSVADASDQTGRYDQDVSSDDHICTVTYNSRTSGGGSPGPTIRHASAADTFYYGYFGLSSLNAIQHWKQVAGSHTQIGSQAAATFSLPDTLSMRAAGSTITRYLNGVSNQATTDTTITGNTRGGIYAYGVVLYLDDWSIDDEVVASGILRQMMMHHI